MAPFLPLYSANKEGASLIELCCELPGEEMGCAGSSFTRCREILVLDTVALSFVEHIFWFYRVLEVLVYVKLSSVAN